MSEAGTFEAQSLFDMHFPPCQLSLMAAGQNRKDPGCQPICLHGLTPECCVMATGQWLGKTVTCVTALDELHQ